MRTPDLLGCPFCGAPGAIQREHDDFGEWFVLGCADSDCCASAIFQIDNPTIDDEDSAIGSWNRRALTPAAVSEAKP